MKTAAQCLKDALATYEARNAVYSNNYQLVGKVMVGLFPEGLTVKTAHDWERLHIFLLQVVKQSRYARNWDNGGHGESMDDLTVYAAILNEIDSQKESE
jgi:hypothetical protein